jgi:hypothetical protein
MNATSFLLQFGESTTAATMFINGNNSSNCNNNNKDVKKRRGGSDYKLHLRVRTKQRTRVLLFYEIKVFCNFLFGLFDHFIDFFHIFIPTIWLQAYQV